MAQNNPMTALQTLLRMKGPANVGAVESNRGLDVLSGMDAFEPSENELIDEQASNPMVSGPYMNFRSRESIRDSAMGNVRKMLGLGAIEHQQKVEQAERPVRLRGEYDLAAGEQKIQGDLINRQTSREEAARAREEAREFQAEQGRLSREHAAALQEDRQAQPAAPRGATDGALKRLEEARQRRGPFGILGPSADKIKASLESVLEQRGSLGDIAAAARDFQAGTMDEAGQQWLQTLDPLEAEYFKILTGR